MQSGSSSEGEKEKLLKDAHLARINKSGAITVAESEVKDDKEEKGTTLVVAFFMMLLFQLGNRIFGRLETFPMHNYPIFMNMLSTVIYIPICFIYILPMLAFTSTISKEQQEIPKYKFGVMGFYDSLAGIMQTFAVNFISNSSTIVLVQQSAIPISMLISKIALQAQYTFSQYLGAAVVLLGIVVVLIPTFLTPPNQTDAGSSPYELLWIFVLVISCVPMCLSSVYKEKALGEMEIDVVYLNGWVAIFQFLFAIPLCIPSAQVINVPIDGILPNMYGGALCWMGIDTIKDASPGMQPDDCSSAPLFVSLYLVFNIIYNLLIVVILKHGSANILWMASTVIVPLSNVAFSLDFMPGHKPLTQFDVAGLFVIMFGLVLYRFMPQMISVWDRMIGKVTEEDVELERSTRLTGKRAEQKQTRFVGINQVEALQSLIDSRVNREQKKQLSRSTQQIRGSLLLRLGIPPSPMISMTPGRRGSSSASPMISSRHGAGVGAVDADRRTSPILSVASGSMLGGSGGIRGISGISGIRGSPRVSSATSTLGNALGMPPRTTPFVMRPPRDSEREMVGQRPIRPAEV